MRAVAGDTPKELLPLNGVPLLRYVLHECFLSGIDSVLLVSSPEKPGIAEFAAVVSGSAGIPERLEVAIQKEPRGLADAIRHGTAFAAGEPVAVALPDNLFAGKTPALLQLQQTFATETSSVVAVTRVTPESASRLGATPPYAGVRRGNLFDIRSIPPKPDHGSGFDLGGAAWAYTGVGRYVFTPEIFQAIDTVDRQRDPAAELDDVPAMRLLLSAHRLVGRVVAGEFFDVGIPDGYAHAIRHADEFALA